MLIFLSSSHFPHTSDQLNFHLLSGRPISHLLLAALQLSVHGRSLQIVGSQQVLVSEKPLNVAAIVHDNSQSDAIYIAAIDTLVENVSILVFDMFQAERTFGRKSEQREKKNENNEQNGINCTKMRTMSVRLLAGRVRQSYQSQSQSHPTKAAATQTEK